MSEKLYRPIIKDGDHLVKSKKNASRVRGISQDENNNTTDIIEWEEVEVEENYSDTDTMYDEQRRVELTPEQEELATLIGTAIAAGIIYGAGKLNEHIIQPWWKEVAKPWIKDRYTGVKQLFSGKTKYSEIVEESDRVSSRNVEITEADPGTEIDAVIDQAFDNLYYDMNTEEAQKHIMKLVYHMLGVAYEIKILSNARIADQFEDEKERLENQAKAERMLANKVASNIDKMLSDDTLLLDVDTSKQLFDILGGGVRLGGQYVPVEVEKVETAINKREIRK